MQKPAPDSNSMILPASQAATFALLVISLICWGSWANTLKLAGKWRFELYYYDFALGFAVLAVVAAFTGGFLNPGELTFQDNFLITGYRNMAYVIAAGIVFNLGNMLLAATISTAGHGAGVHDNIRDRASGFDRLVSHLRSVKRLPACPLWRGAAAGGAGDGRGCVPQLLDRKG